MDIDADEPTRKTHTHQETHQEHGRRITTVLAALLLVSFTWTPVAADSTTDHRVCLGDTQAINERTPDPACATGWIETRTDCSGSNQDYECDVSGRIGIYVDGLTSCGNTTSFWITNNSSTCISPNEPSAGNETPFEHIASYTDIPSHGQTAIFNVTTCVWPGGHNESRFCATFNHTDRIPAAPTGPGNAFDMLKEIGQGFTEHALDKASHTKPPSIHP